MKIVILAGGLGSRLSEETVVKPKPMVEIGGFPIIWHIMKHYSHYGFSDFAICTGYKGEVIKDFFLNYRYYRNDFNLSLATGETKFLTSKSEDWKITFIDSGIGTQTADRLKSVREYLGDEESFGFTYGDGVSNINLTELESFHKSINLMVTMSGVVIPNRYGTFAHSSHIVESFSEKPSDPNSLINGGFFFVKKEIFEFMGEADNNWESDVLPKLAHVRQLGVFQHDGFWHSMDTVRDRNNLESLWASGVAPWKVWNDGITNE
jgi:glucose-1-phosphate cytidylyltransferase